MPTTTPNTDLEALREDITREALAAAGLDHGAPTRLVAAALITLSGNLACDAAGPRGNESMWHRSDLAREMADELLAKLEAEVVDELTAAAADANTAIEIVNANATVSLWQQTTFMFRLVAGLRFFMVGYRKGYLSADGERMNPAIVEVCGGRGDLSTTFRSDGSCVIAGSAIESRDEMDTRRAVAMLAFECVANGIDSTMELHGLAKIHPAGQLHGFWYSAAPITATFQASEAA
jgi:hypothetical protein